MDENTKYIVASNLTVAYFAGMEPQLREARPDGMRTEREMRQPFVEVIGVYRGFLSEIEERGTLGHVGN